jgi:type IV secretory pathway VirB4 component
MFLGKPQNSLFAPFKFLDEHAFVTKSGETGLFAKLDGIDFECLTDGTLEEQHTRLLTAFQSLPEDVRLMSYLVKMDGIQIDPAEHGNPVVDQTMKARTAFLQSRGSDKPLATISLYLCLVHEPKRLLRRNQTSILKVSRKKLEKSLATLHASMRTLAQTVGDLLGITVMHKREVFTFLRFLATLDPEMAAAEPLDYDDNIDHWMSGNQITVHKTGIRNQRGKPEVLTMRKLPKATFPNVLREMLSVSGNFILCSQFKRESTEKALGFVRSAETHWFYMQYIKSPRDLIKLMTSRGDKSDIVADAAAKARLKALGNEAKKLIQGNAHGWYQFTAVVFGEQERIETATTQLIKIVGNQLGSLVRETYYAAGPYASLIPGTTPKYGDKFRKRQRRLPLSQFVDLAFVYNHWQGHKINRHLGQEHLLLLETNDHTPYYFNLHESDLLGVLLLGIMGSGKSFTTNLFIDHSQKYEPFTFILDVGGSYRQITERHGGSYLHMRLRDKAFSINPFVLERTEDNTQFLFSFVRVLLTNAGYQPSASDDKAIWQAVKTAGRLGELEIPEHLKNSLHQWIGDGQYGSLFDNEEDTLNIADFQVFDFQGMELYPQIVEPLLFYIFQRISAIVYNPQNRHRFKQLWADEVWRFLENPTAKQYFMSAGLTWRKHNGGIGLITQSAHSLRNAGLLEIVNEICPTKILLPNPGADYNFYRETFHLNEKEVQQFSTLTPKRQIFVKTPTHSKVLNVQVDQQAAFLYSNDPKSNIRRDELIRQHGGLNEALAALAKGA